MRCSACCFSRDRGYHVTRVITWEIFCQNQCCRLLQPAGHNAPLPPVARGHYVNQSMHENVVYSGVNGCVM